MTLVLKDEIQRLVDAFVAEVTILAMNATSSQLTRALSARPANGNGRVPKRRTVAVVPTKPVNGNDEPRGPELRRRRESQLIRNTMARLLTFVKANPGMRAEDIRTAFGVPFAVIGLPLRKLVQEGLVTMKGNKRWARYYPRPRKPRRYRTAAKPLAEPEPTAEVTTVEVTPSPVMDETRQE